jgi:hypothetical protein
MKIDQVCFVGKPDTQCLDDNAACTCMSRPSTLMLLSNWAGYRPTNW